MAKAPIAFSWAANEFMTLCTMTLTSAIAPIPVSPHARVLDVGGITCTPRATRRFMCSPVTCNQGDHVHYGLPCTLYVLTCYLIDHMLIDTYFMCSPVTYNQVVRTCTLQGNMYITGYHSMSIMSACCKNMYVFIAGATSTGLFMTAFPYLA